MAKTEETFQTEQWETITPANLCAELVRQLPLDFLKTQLAIPVVLSSQEIAIALADPLNVEAYDAIVTLVSALDPFPMPTLTLGQPCQRIVCPETAIESAISYCYYQPDAEVPSKMTDAFDEQLEKELTQSSAEDLLDITHTSPAVKLVNNILYQAIQNRASDVHIEPYETETRVRFRVDGVLHDVMTIPPSQIRSLLSRIKILASLNIAESRLPQDGQSRIKTGDDVIDIRVSVIPTLGGERIVLRILDKGRGTVSLDQIGFGMENLEGFRRLMKLSHGIILLSGPTGSGKTTTLYAALNELNSAERNILTVEDPVEYQLPGIGQMQVKPKIDLTFANCLRHILRQDPDVIMIGEIRDRETAQIAIQAALTGHLVFSTLHTNDSASAMTRLVDMGIEPYLIASTVVAVMAQRLVRTLCPECRAKDPQQEQILASLKRHKVIAQANHVLYAGKGCDNCLDTGYYGRSAISELLVVDDAIRAHIVKRSGSHTLEADAIKRGLVTLRQTGLNRALTGETTVAEVYRVTQDPSLAALEA